MTQTIPVLAPNGLTEILAHYGDPKIRIQTDGTWAVDPLWERANLTTIRHPLLPLGKLYVHRLAAAPLLRLLDRWAARSAAGDPYRIKTLGCFNPRAQRGAKVLASTHTWAIAFDLNADTNPLIAKCPLYDLRRTAPGARDIPNEWIADAHAEGFFWGGDFGGRFDPQHFQLCTGY